MDGIWFVLIGVLAGLVGTYAVLGLLDDRSRNDELWDLRRNYIDMSMDVLQHRVELNELRDRVTVCEMMLREMQDDAVSDEDFEAYRQKLLREAS